MSLVTVGIPTYNRPAGLRRTLLQITNQTYSNLEIIVSDNCSPDPEVELAARAFCARDDRVRYVKQEANLGVAANFKFVLAEATGDYFMWAADDDQWDDYYIKEMVAALAESEQYFVAANFEAQYFDQMGRRFEFFAEGEPFYSFHSDVPFKRLKHMLLYNYGNLVYSVFRTEVLKIRELVFVENEIPTLLNVAHEGNLRVLPQVGFYKQTSLRTYRQARWEMEGGTLGRSLPSLAECRSSYRYHKTALRSIEATLDTLSIADSDRQALKHIARDVIWRHCAVLTLGCKAKRVERGS